MIDNKISTMTYKGYVGTIEFSQSDKVFFGKVLGINGLISYEGADVIFLREDFHAAVDDYISECGANSTETNSN